MYFQYKCKRRAVGVTDPEIFDLSKTIEPFNEEYDKSTKSVE